MHGTLRKPVSLMVMLAVVLGGLMVLPACHSAPGKNKKAGTYYRDVAGSVEYVSEAVRQVMGEMGYLHVTDTMVGDSARLQYRTSFGSMINVKVEPRKSVQPFVRVGVNVNSGDSEGLSQTVLQRVAERAEGKR